MESGREARSARTCVDVFLPCMCLFSKPSVGRPRLYVTICAQREDSFQLLIVFTILIKVKIFPYHRLASSNYVRSTPTGVWLAWGTAVGISCSHAKTVEIAQTALPPVGITPTTLQRRSRSPGSTLRIYRSWKQPVNISLLERKRRSQTEED